MIIQNGLVYQEDKTFRKKDLYLENGRIVDSPNQVTDKEVLDASGLLVLPGLIDVHSHGAVGCDFSDGDGEGLKKILAYEYGHGITSYCPTSMTLEKDTLRRLFRGMAHWQDGRGMAHVAGIHMEGPFLDAAKKGAHREECILAPDVDFFRECNEACGKLIRIVTMAPVMGNAGAAGGEEVAGREDVKAKGKDNSAVKGNVNEGGKECSVEKEKGTENAGWENSLHFIRELCHETVVSLGHTGMDYDRAKAALAAGASHVTHLFNAMMPFNHREPGLVGAAAEDEYCMAELICDGIHVHESMVRAAFRLFPGRIVLISDSMRAAGLGDGAYDLGGQQVNVRGRLAVLEDGTIAGSVTNLYDCMRMAVRFGIPVGEAIAAATMNPAKSIGIYDEVGSLVPGKRADVILVDDKLDLVRIV